VLFTYSDEARVMLLTVALRCSFHIIYFGGAVVLLCTAR
jgi:hypothetical protein